MTILKVIVTSSFAILSASVLGNVMAPGYLVA